MRFITACPQCKVQYWSDETETRQNITCYCGTVIPLKASPGIDARVVRCSSCGAPRQKSAASCQFCHSDFTIHEKDLNTICPECMARISDTSRFCHYCGIAIHPRFSAGKLSDMGCPACDGSKPLFLRREADHFPFFECRICAGVWLHIEDFQEVIRKSKSEESLPLLERFTTAKTSVPNLPKGETGLQTRFYRPCPSCKTVMSRRNIGEKSGIIVDFCKPHGVWFDGNELSQMIDWIRQGGLERAKATPLAEKASVDLRPRRKDQGPAPISIPSSHPISVLDGLIHAVVDIFD